MKLNDIYGKQLNEASDQHDFVIHDWQIQGIEGLVIKPFSVRIKYHGESSEEGNGVEVISAKSDEPVHVNSDRAMHLDHLKNIDGLHALVIGTPASGVMHTIKELFPRADVLNLEMFPGGSRGALELFNYFDDNKNDDVIIDLHGSDVLEDIDVVVIMKELLSDGGVVKWSSHHLNKEFTFSGRIIIVATQPQSQEPAVHKSIQSRCVKIDMTQDKVYPRGTSLSELPGWDESNMEIFHQKALADFTGHAPN